MRLLFCSFLLPLSALAPAGAAIVYSGLQNQVLSASATNSGNNSDRFNLDFDGDGTNDLRLIVSASASLTPEDLEGGIDEERMADAENQLQTRSLTRVVRGSDSTTPAALELGVVVDAAQSYVANNNSFSRNLYTVSEMDGAAGEFGDWTVGQTRYLGVEFDISGQTHYGWVQATIDVGNTDNTPSAAAQLTIVDWAYEATSNTAIVVGAIPEPSTTVFALAGAGLLFRRQRAK